MMFNAFMGKQNFRILTEIVFGYFDLNFRSLLLAVFFSLLFTNNFVKITMSVAAGFLFFAEIFGKSCCVD